MAARINCDGDVFDKLRIFKNSEEERLLKTTLKHIIESDLPFINLVMDSCNGKRGCAFSEACVELAPYIEEVEDVSKLEIGLICMKLLFKLELFENFVENGIDSVMKDTDKATVFLTILEFLRDRRIHGKAIRDIIKGAPSAETPVMIALAQHLFSQLIAGKNYMVDCTAEQLPEKCPDCNVKINAGNTSIGSSSTWHGRADILLNQSIAVAVVTENTSDNTVAESSDTDSDLEPIVKKRKMASDVKTEIGGGRGKDILTSLHTLDQIVAEAVSNGFAQVNMNDSLNDMFIPTIGCTSENASIFLYDPVNDILLQGGDLLQLWHVTPSETLLSGFSTVCLWLFLNFRTFTVKNLKDKVKLDKSKFHEYMKNKLKFYKEMQTGMVPCHITSPRPVGTLTQELRMYCTFRKPKGDCQQGLK